MSTWLDRWIDLYAPLRSKSLKTIERYRGLAGYITHGTTPEMEALAKTNLPELHHTAIEPAILSLLTAPAVLREHLSAHTVRHVGALVRASLQKAYLLELIAANPMLKVELPRFEQHEARCLTSTEIQALRETCRGDWTFAFVELALATGCRRGELLALEWSDMNWLARTIKISKSVEETVAGLRVKSTKGGRPRLSLLPLAAVDALRQLDGKGLLIFADPNGRHRKPALVSQIIVRRLRRAGIEHASLHTLRHTHASHLLSRGVPLPVVSARLGHSNPNTTARIYCHALPSDEHRAADEWDRLLSVE